MFLRSYVVCMDVSLIFLYVLGVRYTFAAVGVLVVSYPFIPMIKIEIGMSMLNIY